MYSHSNKARRLFQLRIINFSRIILLLVSLVLLSGCNTGVSPDNSGVEDIQVYFSPADNCDTHVVAAIENAKQELNIAVYSFNRQSISNAVIAAYNRGVAVRVVFDESQLTGPNSKHNELKNAGIAVRKDKPTSAGTSQMHDKFAIIDKHVVITGSYNWTSNATLNNDENLLIITSDSLSETYNTEFERIWLHAQELEPAD